MGYSLRTRLSWRVPMGVAVVEEEVSVRNNTLALQKHGEYISVLAVDLMPANGELALVQELVAEEFPL